VAGWFSRHESARCEQVDEIHPNMPVTRAAEVLFAGPSEEDLGSGVDSMTVVRRQVEILREVAIGIARDRRRRPKDDLMTNVVQAEVDGWRLTDQEIGAPHTVLALARNPEQKKWLLNDWPARIGTAVDEIRGTTVRAGEKVGLFCCSGNRDETVFDRPGAFDLSVPESACRVRWRWCPLLSWPHGRQDATARTVPGVAHPSSGHGGGRARMAPSHGCPRRQAIAGVRALNAGAPSGRARGGCRLFGGRGGPRGG
jgi:hypothetical protein